MEGTLRTIPICSDELRVYSKYPIDSAATLARKKVALMARSVIAATYDLQCEYLDIIPIQKSCKLWKVGKQIMGFVMVQ